MKKKTFPIIVSAVSLQLFIVAHSFAQTHPITTTTLCDIVRNPRSFDHKLVKFRAEYFGDGIEHVVLLDRSNCSLGIKPEFPDKLDGLEQLDNAIRTDHWGFEGKTISAVWVGTFRWRPKLRLKTRVL
jgi:hypothetical protein